MSGESNGPANAAEPADSSVGGETSATIVRPKSGPSTLELPERGEAPSLGRQADLPSLKPGDQLAGRFLVLRFIARGGMGAVYESNDVMLQTRVALKVLQGRVTADAAAMKRFQREVLLARRVTHPNVCRVYEFYESTTATGELIHFLTMEYLEGETLAARIARTGRLSTLEARPLVQQMCDGLSAAHAEGVIHRDFKSNNVVLVPRTGDTGRASDGLRVAITDFGIARALDAGSSQAGAEGLTGGAGILGTPEYMAPEQVTGGPVSTVTDLYALGVVMYEMVTGRLPFSGETPLATAARRINEPPPRPELVAPELDPRWSRTILKLLDRDPQRRFQHAADVVRALSKEKRRPGWLVPAAGAVLLLLVLAVAMGTRLVRWPSHSETTPASTSAAQPSIAVLAFVDMSPAHDQEYFSDGIAQEIIGALTQVPGLHVAARSSSFSFKGKNEDLRTVGQKLDVANVLEGSVRKSGSHLRVTAQLVNAATGYELWSQTFDRELADVFAVQDEIARAVVSALKMKVLPAAGAAHPVTSPEAYTHYLRGLQYENIGSTSELGEAIQEYKRAIALDPSYAPAHARLAWALFFHADQQGGSPNAMQGYKEAMAEAERAVELDPNGGDGYVARGFLKGSLNQDWPGGLKDFERAVALSPGDARARTWLGTSLAGHGKLAQAIEAGQAAVQLDPLSSEARFRLASFYDGEGNYAEARVLLKRALEIAPHYGLALRQLGFTELLDGHPAEALAVFRMHDEAWVRNLGGALAYYSLGKLKESQAELDLLIVNFPGAEYQIAQVYAWRGEGDLAFAALERARTGHDAGLAYLKYDPFMRPLRGDPRFAALLEKLKMPPN